jgi:hypothetical protein
MPQDAQYNLVTITKKLAFILCQLLSHVGITLAKTKKKIQKIVSKHRKI